MCVSAAVWLLANALTSVVANTRNLVQIIAEQTSPTKQKTKQTKRYLDHFLTVDKAKTNTKKALVQLSQKGSEVPALGLRVVVLINRLFFKRNKTVYSNKKGEAF